MRPGRRLETSRSRFPARLNIADYSSKWKVTHWKSVNTRGFVGSNRTQKPICLLAEPLVSDRVAVQHKNVLRFSGQSRGEQSSRSTAGRLVAFEVRIEPAEE